MQNSATSTYSLTLKAAVEVLGLCSSSTMDAKQNHSVLKMAYAGHRFSHQLTLLLNEAYKVVVEEGHHYSEVCNAVARDGVLIEKIKQQLDLIPDDPKLIVKLDGTWIWITGSTYKNRKELRAAGFKFNSKKASWYWGPAAKSKKRYNSEIALGDHHVYTYDFNEGYRPTRGVDF